MSNRRVIGYIRVSTQKQLTGKGLAEQKAAIERYAQQELSPHTGFKIYIEQPIKRDSPVADRPELQAALNDVCGSKGILIVRDITRVSTNHETLEILSRLQSCGCDFVSLRESVTTLYFGKEKAYGWASALGQHELLRLRKIAVDGAAKHKSQGKRWGRVPFGYCKSNEGKFVPDPDHYPVLMEIVDRNQAGESFYSIAKCLNSRLVRTQTGKLWEARQIANACQAYLRECNEIMPG